MLRPRTLPVLDEPSPVHLSPALATTVPDGSIAVRRTSARKTHRTSSSQVSTIRSLTAILSSSDAKNFDYAVLLDQETESLSQAPGYPTG